MMQVLFVIRWKKTRENPISHFPPQKESKNAKTIFGKVRKALGNVSALTSEKGLVSPEARVEQVNLIKVGNTPLLLLTGLKTTPFSDVTAGCATIFGHVRLSPFLSFLRISVFFGGRGGWGMGE